jgi:glycerophosphoryl diester phosphodiesterase
MVGMLLSCNNKIDIQGHRGCRGLYPENTLEAFEAALDMGVNTLEMDVVISKDKKVVVSHEAFFNHEISLTPQGQDITREEERKHNIFKLNYDEIIKYDVGSKNYPRFPLQKKIKTKKPLLSEVINLAKSYSLKHNRPLPYFNIEIKTEPDAGFNPSGEEFATLVYQDLKKANVLKNCIIQSFDHTYLNAFHTIAPSVHTAILVEDLNSPSYHLDKLNHKPKIYSPYFKLVDDEFIKEIKKYKMKIIPWTLNEVEDIDLMLLYKVDGIISDYPDRVKDRIKKLTHNP